MSERYHHQATRAQNNRRPRLVQHGGAHLGFFGEAPASGIMPPAMDETSAVSSTASLGHGKAQFDGSAPCSDGLVSPSCRLSQPSSKFARPRIDSDPVLSSVRARRLAQGDVSAPLPLTGGKVSDQQQEARSRHISLSWLRTIPTLMCGILERLFHVRSAFSAQGSRDIFAGGKSLQVWSSRSPVSHFCFVKRSFAQPCFGSSYGRGFGRAGRLVLVLFTALMGIFIAGGAWVTLFPQEQNQSNQAAVKEDNLANLEASNPPATDGKGQGLNADVVRQINQPYLDFVSRHVDQYGADLLELADKRPDTLPVILSYPELKGVISDTALIDEDMADLRQGRLVPHLLQWDKRWAFLPYGDGKMISNACGPTCLSMVTVGLTGNKEWTPLKIAQYADKHNYYVNGVGSSWSLMTDLDKLLGIKSKTISSTPQAVKKELQAGHPVVVAVKSGDFTTTGHFIVLSQVLEDGHVMVSDPSSYITSERSWDINTILNQSQGLWAFST